MAITPKVDQLVEALRCLPSVGPKSAQRMAMHLLQKDRGGAQVLMNALSDALDDVGHCIDCRALSETERCHICSDVRRNHEQLCIVESPADLLAIESTAGYEGVYYLLMGNLSPIDGMGPEEIGLPQLFQRVSEGGIKEVILATNPTVEGEATAHFITEQLKPLNVLVTRIAHGVPLGGELEYVDGSTLNHAISGRKAVSKS